MAFTDDLKSDITICVFMTLIILAVLAYCTIGDKRNSEIKLECVKHGHTVKECASF